ncbi:MAG: hypothetical protein AB1938_15010 [Myxococcota bacterium]
MATLERTFDKRSPAIRQELAHFEAELKQLERAVAPHSLLVNTTRRGHLLHICVISAQVKQATHGTSTLEPWRP